MTYSFSRKHLSIDVITNKAVKDKFSKKQLSFLCLAYDIFSFIYFLKIGNKNRTESCSTLTIRQDIVIDFAEAIQ